MGSAYIKQSDYFVLTFALQIESKSKKVTIVPLRHASDVQAKNYGTSSQNPNV